MPSPGQKVSKVNYEISLSCMLGILFCSPIDPSGKYFICYVQSLNVSKETISEDKVLILIAPFSYILHLYCLKEI